MSDLISRSELIKLINTKYIGLNDAVDLYHGGKFDCFKEIKLMIKKQPTAYDIDKVVEELEQKKEEVQRMRNTCVALSDLEVCDIENVTYERAIEIVKQEAEQYNNGWIPFVQREMTEDEKESFGDLNFMLDCKLPDEDEEILITYKFKDELYVDVDTFMRDGSECYLDSGRDFVTEAVAWRKKPQPFQPKGE